MILRILKLSALSSKQCFFIGVTVGIILSLNIQNYELPRSSTCEAEGDTGEFEPKVNLAQKPMQAKKAVKNIVRPRYATSELGIREKVFVAVLAKVESIETTTTAFNRTVAHLVDKIKYFINAESVKYNFKLKNIVGFTDTRENLRVYHVLKYVADNYLNDYDYFLFVPDTVYLNARVLVEKLRKISVSADVYMGQKLSSTERLESFERGEENFCDLDAGVILSNSVVKKIRNNLDWCVKNSVTKHHHINIGKCVHYATDIRGCQTSYQNVSISQYKLNNYKIYRDLHYLKEDGFFNEAVTVYPITNADDFYLLHIYFSRVNLQTVHERMDANNKEYSNVKYGNLPDALLEKRWPIGVPESKPAETRHDIITWQHVNESHIFMWNTEENVKELPQQDREDLDNIIKRVVAFTASKNPELLYSKLQSAYKKYDPVRGMDYILHLKFQRRGSSDEILRSFEVVKPLGSVEIVQSPYVTEGSKVSLVVPVFEHQVPDSTDFLAQYQKICLENRENTFLMLVFVYATNTVVTATADPFLELKNSVLKLTDTYKTDGPKVAWLSIRLPEVARISTSERGFKSVYGTKEVLSLGVTDLALRKIGTDSLVLLMPNSAKFYPDFLNRVRMNTIQNFQVYSPIAFTHYPCGYTSLCKACEACDVSQSTGYFDTENFDVIAFYGKDYVESRRTLESQIPIVKKDKDVELLFQQHTEVSGIIDMFLKSPINIHVLRAIEPNLRLGSAFASYLKTSENIEECFVGEKNRCMRLGSKKQLSEATTQFEDEVVGSKTN